MPAIVNPSTTPLQAPERVQPQAVPPAPQKHTSWRKWLVFAILAVVAVGAYWLLKPRQEQKAAVSATVRTAQVTSGPLERVLRVAGSTSARNFANITAPMMRGPDAGRALILIYLAKSGGMVKKGEIIAQIDAQSVKDHVDDIDSQVQQAEADIRKRRAEQAIEMENLRQNLRVTKATLDKAKLDAGASEIRTPIDVELLKLAVEESEAQYNQLQGDLKTTETLHKAEIRILEYTRDRHARHRDRHKGDIEKFTVHAPIGGLAVMQTIFRGGDMGQVQEGDQVSPGQPFMKIVDTSSMQLEATVNQVASEAIRIGQRATLNFDAFPGLHLEGKVQSVGAMGVGGWRQNFYVRNVPVRISIIGSDSRIIPDLSASGDVMLERKDNALIAPIEAVSSEGGKSVVLVKEGDQFRTREVQLGIRNDTHVAVLSGLKAGEEIALQRPSLPTS